MYKIISTCSGLLVNVNILHLMDDPGLDPESEMDNRVTDEIGKKKKVCRLDSNRISMMIS